MATVTLELVDMTGDQPEPTGDSATLVGSRIVYIGNGVRNLFAPWLRDNSPADVFRDMNGWSNGYVSLREKGN